MNLRAYLAFIHYKMLICAIMLDLYRTLHRLTTLVPP